MRRPRPGMSSQGDLPGHGSADTLWPSKSFRDCGPSITGTKKGATLVAKRHRLGTVEDCRMSTQSLDNHGGRPYSQRRFTSLMRMVTIAVDCEGFLVWMKTDVLEAGPDEFGGRVGIRGGRHLSLQLP